TGVQTCALPISGMLDIFLEKPSDAFQNIIEWSKENLLPHFPPGEGFHYSDTGYYLLNLIIEEITMKSYPETLKSYFFQPLEMNQDRKSTRLNSSHVSISYAVF